VEFVQNGNLLVRRKRNGMRKNHSTVTGTVEKRNNLGSCSAPPMEAERNTLSLPAKIVQRLMRCTDTR